MRRPSFNRAWTAFVTVRVSAAEVGRKIGGAVQKDVEAGIFQNACPIRMSYVLKFLCSDTWHLTSDPDNGPFVPDSASLWVLP